MTSTNALSLFYRLHRQGVLPGRKIYDTLLEDSEWKIRSVDAWDAVWTWDWAQKGARAGA